jgi:hypothetical protein
MNIIQSLNTGQAVALLVPPGSQTMLLAANCGGVAPPCLRVEFGPGDQLAQPQQVSPAEAGEAGDGHVLVRWKLSPIQVVIPEGATHVSLRRTDIGSTPITVDWR